MTFPVMIFAAGLGTRMGPLTRTQPKAMIELAGKPLLRHALDLALEAGVDRVVVNVHYLADQIEDHLRGFPQVLISDERGQLLETGGGLRKARELLGSSPVFSVNSDAAWAGPNPFEVLRANWDAQRMDALLLCCGTADVLGYDGPGDFSIGDAGRLTRGPGAVFTGAQIIKTELLEGISETAFSLNVAWDIMAERGRLFGCLYGGSWCDVGSPDRLAAASKMLMGSAAG